MTSQIDPTLPITGTPTTASVRGNFQIAHDEITALQSGMPTASGTTPAMDGTATAGVGTTWARGDHVHPTDTTRAAVGAIPIASTTNPTMNGAVAVGTGTTFARADHVHPSDTSKLSTGGGTLTGTLTGTTIVLSGRMTPDNFVIGHGGGLGLINQAGQSMDAGNGAWFEQVGPAAPIGVNQITGTGGPQIIFYTAGTAIGSITSTATSTAYNTTSDERLKEDAQPFDAGPILDATNVYNFAWKNTGERAYGVIAQEAVEVFPDAVTYDKPNDWWGVDYSKYVPLLLAEVKALRARLATLEGK